MRYLDGFSTWKSAVKQENCWAVGINNGLDYTEGLTNYLLAEITKTFKEETQEYWIAILHAELILFDTEEEAFNLYDILNSGPLYASPLYACVINPSGEILTENT